MTYRFDPELAAVIPMLPMLDFSDLASVRALLAGVRGGQQHDTTGIDVRDVHVPGSPDHPEVPVRVYRPACHRPTSWSWSSTRCATRASPTPKRCSPLVFQSSSTCSPERSTAPGSRRTAAVSRRERTEATAVLAAALDLSRETDD